MKVQLSFAPLVVEVPDEIIDQDRGFLADVEDVIEYVNENWINMVDPSQPTIIGARVVPLITVLESTNGVKE